MDLAELNNSRLDKNDPRVVVCFFLTRATCRGNSKKNISKNIISRFEIIFQRIGRQENLSQLIAVAINIT